MSFWTPGSLIWSWQPQGKASQKPWPRCIAAPSACPCARPGYDCIGASVRWVGASGTQCIQLVCLCIMALGRKWCISARLFCRWYLWPGWIEEILKLLSEERKRLQSACQQSRSSATRHVPNRTCKSEGRHLEPRNLSLHFIPCLYMMWVLQKTILGMENVPCVIR